MTTEIRRYDFIDALRGYAILLVILVHSSEQVPAISLTLHQFMTGGARGVQLFFIASAMALCMSWRSRSIHETSPVQNFFVRRFFRIAPMFYIAIVFYVMLYGFSPRSWAPRGFDWWSVLLTVLFLSGFHPATITSVVPGGWSIVAEVNFYLILPFLLDRLTTIKSSIYFLLFSLGMYGISRIIFKYLFFGAYSADQHTLISNFVFMNFFGQLPIFGMGIFAYFLFSSPKSLKLPVIFGNLLLISWLMILILLPSSAVTRLLGNYFAIGAAFALFAVTLGTFPVRFLVNRFIIIIGKISFSMYLVHFAVSYFFARFGISAFFGQSDVSSVLHFLCIVAVTVPLSAFFYITVEQQGILLGKRVIDRMEQGAPLGRRKAADEFISS